MSKPAKPAYVAKKAKFTGISGTWKSFEDTVRADFCTTPETGGERSMQYLLQSEVEKITPDMLVVEGPQPKQDSNRKEENLVAATGEETSSLAPDEEDDSENKWFHESELQMRYHVITSDSKYQWSEEVTPLKLYEKLRDKHGNVVKKDGKTVYVDMEMAKFSVAQTKDVVAKNEKLEKMFTHMVACILERLDENLCRKLEHCLRSPRLIWETLNCTFGDLNNPVAEGVYRWSRVMNLVMKHTETFDSFNTKFDELWGADTELDPSFKHYRILIKDKDNAVRSCLPKRMHPAIDKAILEKMDLRETITHFLHYDGLFHVENEGKLDGMKDAGGETFVKMGAVIDAKMSLEQIKKLKYVDLCPEAKSARLWCANCHNTRLHTADKCGSTKKSKKAAGGNVNNVGITCRGCGKTGHIARYCPANKSGKGKGGGKPNGKWGGNKSRKPQSAAAKSETASDDDEGSGPKSSNKRKRDAKSVNAVQELTFEVEEQAQSQPIELNAWIGPDYSAHEYFEAEEQQEVGDIRPIFRISMVREDSNDSAHYESNEGNAAGFDEVPVEPMGSSAEQASAPSIADEGPPIPSWCYNEDGSVNRAELQFVQETHRRRDREENVLEDPSWSTEIFQIPSQPPAPLCMFQNAVNHNMRLWNVDENDNAQGVLPSSGIGSAMKRVQRKPKGGMRDEMMSNDLPSYGGGANSSTKDRLRSTVQIENYLGQWTSSEGQLQDHHLESSLRMNLSRAERKACDTPQLVSMAVDQYHRRRWVGRKDYQLHYEFETLNSCAEALGFRKNSPVNLPPAALPMADRPFLMPVYCQQEDLHLLVPMDVRMIRIDRYPVLFMQDWNTHDMLMINRQDGNNSGSPWDIDHPDLHEVKDLGMYDRIMNEAAVMLSVNDDHHAPTPGAIMEFIHGVLERGIQYGRYGVDFGIEGHDNINLSEDATTFTCPPCPEDVNPQRRDRYEEWYRNEAQRMERHFRRQQAEQQEITVTHNSNQSSAAIVTEPIENITGRVRSLEEAEGSNSDQASTNVRRVNMIAVKRDVIEFRSQHPMNMAYRMHTMLLDTGAHVNCVPTEQWLDRRYPIVRYSNATPCPMRLITANGGEMVVMAKGRINEWITDVYVVKNCSPLLSVTYLQSKDLKVITTTKRDCPTDTVKAVVVNDLSGEVVMHADGGWLVNVDQCGPRKYEKYILKTTNLQPVVESINLQANSVNAAHLLYGMDARVSNVEELVRFEHCKFHHSEKVMSWQAESSAISNYSVTRKQIQKNWFQCISCMKGSMRSRLVNNKRNYGEKPEAAEEPKPSDPSSRKEIVEERNRIVAFQNGMDIVGPFLGRMMMPMTEKATGFSKSVSIPKKNCSEQIKALRILFNFWRKYMHHNPEYGKPINELITDSDKTLQTEEMKAFFAEQGVIHTTSPPGQQALDGLAENRNKQNIQKVITFYAEKPYVPEHLWPWAWHLADLGSNLKRSRIPGSNITRHEEFTGEKPNYKTTVYLPFGLALEIYIPKAYRSKYKFAYHSFTGMYMGPSPTVRGGLIAYNPRTKRICVANQYRILTVIPKSWVDTDTIPGSFLTGPDDEMAGSIYHEWEKEDEPLISDPYYLTGEYPKPVEEDNYWVDEPLMVAPDPLLTEELDSQDGSDSDDSFVQAAVGARVIRSKKKLKATRYVPDREIMETLDEESAAWARIMREAKSVKPLQFYQVCRVRQCSEYIYREEGDSLPISKKLFTENLDTGVISVVEYESATAAICHVKSTTKKRKRRTADNPTLTQAMRGPDKALWKAAQDAEDAQMRDDGVISKEIYFRVKGTQSIPKGGIRLPSDAIVLETMYVLQIKRHKDESRSIDKYKARLVCLGNMQTAESYDKIKSPTARSSTSKMLMSIQAKLGLKARIFDVKGAYLKSKIDESKNEHLYIRLPNGEIHKLFKYLYGLKQAGREWNNLLTRTMIKGGYSQSLADPCVFSKWNGTEFIIMCTHVDDFYVISTSNAMLDDLYNYWTVEFGEVTQKTDDLAEYLGMVIQVLPSGEVLVTQPAYVAKMLEEFGCTDINVVDTPCPGDYDNRPSTADDPEVDQTEYLRILGTLNYLAVFTRPDILYAISRCAQKAMSPRRWDMKNLKRILRYVKGTAEKGLLFSVGDRKSIVLEGYVDASHNHYAEDARGHMGMNFRLGPNDGAFYARSQKMKLVTLSSTETEYVALCEAATEVVFLRQLLADIGFPQKDPTVLYEDNQSTMAMADGGGQHQRSKHINVKYHFVREQIQLKSMILEYCPTEEMVADLLTKNLKRGPHEFLTRLLLNT
jgi:hypothetical protein